MMRGLADAVDVLLPRVCVVCGDRLLANEKIVCLHCLADMPLTHFWQLEHNPMADRFNTAVQDGLEAGWSTIEWQSGTLLTEETREKYSYACALFFYSHEAAYRHILYNLKYEGRIDVGRLFGRMLGSRLKTSAAFKDVDCVMPVPLHWLRRWRRGYNQAEVIAREVSTALGVRLECHVLYRRRRTRTQTRLEISAKRANVSGAFGIRATSADALKDTKHILLVDDVFTTGSTLHACFVALRSVFPPSVRISVATLAFVGEV